MAKTFACEYSGCTQVFGKRDHLLRHQRGQHTLEKPFSCCSCEKAFTRSDVLRRHIKGTHGQPESNSNSTADHNAAHALSVLPQMPTNLPSRTSRSAQTAATGLHALPPINELYFSNAASEIPFQTTPIAPTLNGPSPVTVDPNRPVDPLIRDLNGAENFNTSPLPDLWDTSLFDFGQLFRSSADIDDSLFNFQMLFADFCLPSVTTPADRLAQMWPTRPSRRSQEVKPADLVDPRARTHRSLAANDRTLDRMHRHLSGGGIPFRRTLPSADVLGELLQLYFEHWNPLWPMLHEPTFDVNASSSLLILCMCGIGALFLSTPEGNQLSLDIMNKMHESLSFCMSAQLEKYDEKMDQDILSICQAYMLRQLYWLVAGDRDQLESTMLFHSIVASMSRRAGVFAEVSPVPDTTKSIPLPQDVEIEWRCWVAKEVKRRTALCFIVNDLAFSLLYLQPAMASIGNVNWSLPLADAMFEASDARSWKQLHVKTLQIQKSPPLHDLSTTLFSDKPEALFATHVQSQFSVHLLVSSILSVVLTTRVTKSDLDEEILKHSFPQNPILKSLQAAWDAIQMLQDADLFCSRSIWHAAWLHLTTDIRVIEVACGREGSEAANAAARQVSQWANSPLGRRAVLHAVAILQQAKATSIGVEAPPHLYINLYQASLVLCIFCKFALVNKNKAVPKDIDWSRNALLGFPHATIAQPSEAQQWVISGNATASGGVKISRILPELQQTLSRIGYTQLRTMLNNVVDRVVEVDKPYIDGVV